MAAKKSKKAKKHPPAKRSPRGSLPDWLVEGQPAKSSTPNRSGSGATRSKRKEADDSAPPERKLVHLPEPPEFRDASRARASDDYAGVTSASPLPAEPLRAPGRPTMRTPEIEDQLLDWLSCGGPLRAFCRLAGMPSHTTVHRWRKEDKPFAARYLAAKQIGYDEIGEQCLEIADTPLIGEIREEGEGSGGEDGEGGTWSKVKREDMLGHRKLQIWTRLQLLAKWFPKKYGNKLDVDASGTLTFDDKLRAALGLPALEKAADDKKDDGG